MQTARHAEPNRDGAVSQDGADGHRWRQAFRFMADTVRSARRKARIARRLPDDTSDGEDPTLEAASVRGLLDDGIVFVPDWLPPERCEALRTDMEALVATHPSTTRLESGTVIEHRNADGGWDWDIGVIDIHHVEHEVPEVRRLLMDPMLTRIASAAAGRGLVPAKANCYINREVAKTRGYHVDSYSSVQFKMFVYLSDVEGLDDGPLSYVKGSHRAVGRKLRNLVRLAPHEGTPLRDVVTFDEHDATHCLAARGTLLIGDMNGVHRAWPQAPGHERVLLVLQFMAPHEAAAART